MAKKPPSTANKTHTASLSIKEVTSKGIVIVVECEQRRYNVLFTEKQAAELLNELIPAFMELAWPPFEVDWPSFPDYENNAYGILK